MKYLLLLFLFTSCASPKFTYIEGKLIHAPIRTTHGYKLLLKTDAGDTLKVYGDNKHYKVGDCYRVNY